MAIQAEIDLLDKLANQIPSRQYKIRKRNRYYKGAQRLQMMGISTPPELRKLQTVVNWCRVAVDSLGERLDVESFRTGTKSVDKLMWDWWKFNRMQVEADSAHLESLIQGASFVVIGRDPVRQDMPRFTIESARCMQVELDPAGRDVLSALRMYTDDDGKRQATLYLPLVTIYLEERGNGWLELSRDNHGLGIVPVVPLINRTRVDDRFGESEMTDVMSIVDAVCRTATNLAAAGETLAVPSRYVMGASESDFIDQDGNPVPAWEAYMGRLNALTNPDAKVIQLAGADLTNFTQTLNAYAGLTSSVTGLPVHYLGLVTQNPASADAIRSSESRHIKRAERKQETFGDGGWSRVQDIAYRLIVGTTPPAMRIETVWRDAATPTIAAKTDAVVKLVSAHIIPVEGAWIELGYSQEKRELYRSLLSTDPLERMLASLGVDPTSQPTSQPAPPTETAPEPAPNDA